MFEFKCSTARVGTKLKRKVLYYFINKHVKYLVNKQRKLHNTCNACDGDVCRHALID